MTSATVMQFFLTLLPTLIVGLVAYYFFANYIRNEEGRRHYELRKESLKELIPYRLQALERMALYLERIDLGSLVLRIKPAGATKQVYENKLVKAVQEEFEHNQAQQIYLSTECWDAVRATKNATIALIRKVGRSEQIDSAEKLRESLLKELIKTASPSQTGLEYIRKETREMW